MGIVKSEPEHNIRGVGLLHKAFQILELFSPEQSSWTQVEIGRAADLPRSTVSRLVRYLCARGYLSFHERSGRYTLGFSAIELGRRAQAQLDLAAFAEDVLEDLARRTRETVMLTGFNPAALHVVCLAQIPSQHGVLRVYETVGATFPLYAGASTKPVLAHLPEAVIERVLAGPMPPINPEWTTKPDHLRADIERTRQRGFAVSFEETYPGVAGVGAAILGPDGRPLGSLAVAAPLQRMSEASMEELGRAVAEAAAAVSARLAGDVPKPEQTGA
ncbi:IclR family transcriptional regulator [Nitratireductor pacificus]|uniref:IclR family transcriptional regulator n=1 Tax=Nitratireductor pacificus pht-3B TaxID=391937 RepID=K2N611_9HYPH|nr:IclR family transcriptional regulator [Nitratireductor pacificus]EKF19583.1 IclR family transcriptional regulator [Nitratireductor pacificus pht-3B]